MSDGPTSLNNSNKVTIFSLLLICILILAYGFFYSENTTTSLAHLLGYNLPFAFIIWGVFYFFLGKKSTLNIKGMSFFIILVAMMVSGFIAATIYENDSKQVLTNLVGNLNKMVESSIDEDGIPKKIDASINPGSAARGKAGVIEVFVNSELQRQITLQNNYIKELDAAGWNSLLQPNRLASDKTFSQSKLILKKGKEIASKTKKLKENYYDNVINRIESLDLTEKDKTVFRESYLKGVANSGPARKRVWELEFKIFGIVAEMIGFLESNKNGWVVRENEIRFYKDEHITTYNSHLESLVNYVKEQTELQQENLKRVTDKLI